MHVFDILRYSIVCHTQYDLYNTIADTHVKYSENSSTKMPENTLNVLLFIPNMKTEYWIHSQNSQGNS